MNSDGNEWTLIEPGVLHWAGTQLTVNWDGICCYTVKWKGRAILAAGTLEAAKRCARDHADRLISMGFEP